MFHSRLFSKCPICGARRKRYDGRICNACVASPVCKRCGLSIRRPTRVLCDRCMLSEPCHGCSRKLQPGDWFFCPSCSTGLNEQDERDRERRVFLRHVGLGMVALFNPFVMPVLILGLGFLFRGTVSIDADGNFWERLFAVSLVLTFVGAGLSDRNH